MKTALVILILTSTIASAESKTASASSGGRYQVLQLSDMRRDQILIDTQTGKTWHWACLVDSRSSNSADCGYGAWTLDDAEGITIQKNQIIDKANKLEKFQQEQAQKKD
jgi:hypothetical protein